MKPARVVGWFIALALVGCIADLPAEQGTSTSAGGGGASTTSGSVGTRLAAAFGAPAACATCIDTMGGVDSLNEDCGVVVKNCAAEAACANTITCVGTQHQSHPVENLVCAAEHCAPAATATGVLTCVAERCAVPCKFPPTPCNTGAGGTSSGTGGTSSGTGGTGPGPTAYDQCLSFASAVANQNTACTSCSQGACPNLTSLAQTCSNYCNSENTVEGYCTCVLATHAECAPIYGCVYDACPACR